MHFKRMLPVPQKSFFLFGPRGTGKSTWLKEVFNPQLTVNLLKTDDYLSYSANPSQLRHQVLALPQKSKIVIDEVQKIPALLNEVQYLLFESNHNYTFALTGSSARKLKGKDINLLAGRAATRNMFTLNSNELGKKFDLMSILSHGSLPQIYSCDSRQEIIDYLLSYANTYLKEEIQQEALVRNLNSYHRFLRHMALMNGQVLNLQTISQESSVPRASLSNYLTILQDTLLGDVLEPLHLKAKVKEVSTPKFYFFDVGIVHALRNELKEKSYLTDGSFLENFILNELKSYSHYTNQMWEFNYWGTPSNNEVDFVISSGRKRWALEVKMSKNWKNEFNTGLKVLLAENKITRAIGIYNGDKKLKIDKLEIYPIEDFLELLYLGKFDF